MRDHSKAPSAKSIGGHHRFGLALFASLALVLMCGFFASASQAATIYRFEGKEFGTMAEASEKPSQEECEEEGRSEEECKKPTRIEEAVQGVAVDNQTGLALISINGGGVGVYETNGTSTVQVEIFGKDELNNPALAIDQAERALYATNSVGQIVKYDISGSGPLNFTLDTSFTSPTGFFGSVRLAVDPTTDDLLAASRFEGSVNRYESDGTFVSSFNGAGSLGGTFNQIYGLAVDPTGSIYVVDVKTDLFFEDANSIVERFASDGTPDPSFKPEIRTPNTVAVDQSTGNVLVVGRTDGWKEATTHEPSYPVRLFTIHGSQIIDELDFPARNETAVTTLAGGGGANAHLYAALFSGFTGGTESGAYALKPFKVADLQFDPIGAVTPFTAQLSGSVNPLGQKTTYHFEYSREGGPVQSTATLPVVEGAGQEEGNNPVPVSVELTDLIPNSDYEVRLAATSNGVTERTAAQHITTLPAPPQAVTGDAYDLTRTSATLAGQVNPYGYQTNYWFEYGPTTAYGMRSPADHGEVAGEGREALVASAYLHGLKPDTEYHYRLVVTNGAGTTLGVDRAFTTTSLAAPPRIFEQVSPVEKGANVNGLRGMNVSPDGSHVMYEWKTAPLGAAASPAFARSAAIRSPFGWSFLPLDPPQLTGSTELVNHFLVQLTLGVSEDGTKAVVASLKKLAPGAVEGTTNLYLRDTSTGELTTIGHTENIYMFMFLTTVGNAVVIDGTPDYSHLLLVSLAGNFTALPEGPEQGLYEFSEGELHTVSIAPDGTQMSYVRQGGTAGNSSREMHFISDDASKIFFAGNENAAYVRYPSEESTTKIGGTFCGASRDGHYAFVAGGTPGAGLAEGLYRFNTTTKETVLLAPNVPTEGCTVVSPNGQSAFFWTSAVLTNDAEPGKLHTYVWHLGEITLVANTRVGIDTEYFTSASGRYFAFRSYDRLTEYDNSSKTACLNFDGGDPKGPNNEGVACPEIYRFDVDTEQVTCASCRRDGGPPTGSPRLGTNSVEGQFRFQRSMLDDGTVIFDTPDPLSALDSNSNRDVYTYDGSEQTLISSGFENSRSEFDGASADGSDIFFTTQDQLVGQDTDSLADIYDARIEGGIPGQNPPPPRPECIRDDCKGTPGQGPELPFGGSEGLSGPGNVQTTPTRKRCGKGTHARKAKGKTRCVKQAKKQHKKQAKSNRRQGR